MEPTTLGGLIATLVVIFLAQRFMRRRPKMKRKELGGAISSVKDLEEHTKVFEEKLHKVASNVWVAVGYGLANSIMVEGKDGVVIIDVCESAEPAKKCLAAFRSVSSKPIKALIFTHFHTDHVGGAGVFLADASSDCEIWAHETTGNHMTQFNLVMGPLAFTRASRQFGNYLKKPSLENSGIGPFLCTGHGEETSMVLPTHTFADKHTINVGGVELLLEHSPGETDDQIVVYYEAKKILFAADNFYEAFPNLYAIRGVPHRDTMQWARTLDQMRSHGAEIMVPSHTLPVYGAAEVNTRLQNYRDAIQYVHDQTVRLALKGRHPADIANQIKLPQELASLEYLKEFYGTIHWSSRSVFTGYIGWFSGDASELFELSTCDRAERLIDLAGGQDALLEKCKKAVEEKDWQWGLELATAVLRVDSGNMEAGDMKVSCLRALGSLQVSANGRNYYFTQGLEARGDVTLKLPREMRDGGIDSARIENLFDILPLRVVPKAAAGMNTSMCVSFTDVGKAFTLTLRNCVMVVEHADMPGANIRVSCTVDAWKKLLKSPTSMVGSWFSGSFAFERGNVGAFSQFFGVIDKSV